MFYLACRLYMGSSPYVVVSDVEALKEIFVKQFNNLPNREVRALSVWCVC